MLFLLFGLLFSASNPFLEEILWLRRLFFLGFTVISEPIIYFCRVPSFVFLGEILLRRLPTTSSYKYFFFDLLEVTLTKCSLSFYFDFFYKALLLDLGLLLLLSLLSTLLVSLFLLFVFYDLITLLVYKFEKFLELLFLF